jgi:hypothetical protein
VENNLRSSTCDTSRCKDEFDVRTRKVTVATTKQCVETNCCTWLLRKVRQVWDGSFRWRAMYFATVAWDTAIPSLNSSPWRRGAPQSGFAKLIFRINSRTSELIVGSTLPTPIPAELLFACQATTVSGFTRSSAKRQFDQRRESQTQSSRSAESRRSRFTLRSLQDYQPVAQRKVFQLQRCSSSKPRSDADQRRKERSKHGLGRLATALDKVNDFRLNEIVGRDNSLPRYRVTFVRVRIRCLSKHAE